MEKTNSLLDTDFTVRVNVIIGKRFLTLAVCWNLLSTSEGRVPMSIFLNKLH